MQEKKRPPNLLFRGKTGRIAAVFEWPAGGSEAKTGFLDMEAVWRRYIRESGKELDWFKRDSIHANERGEQIIGRILAAYLSASEAAAPSPNRPNIRRRAD